MRSFIEATLFGQVTAHSSNDLASKGCGKQLCQTASRHLTKCVGNPEAASSIFQAIEKSKRPRILLICSLFLKVGFHIHQTRFAVNVSFMGHCGRLPSKHISQNFCLHSRCLNLHVQAHHHLFILCNMLWLIHQPVSPILFWTVGQIKISVYVLLYSLLRNSNQYVDPSYPARASMHLI